MTKRKTNLLLAILLIVFVAAQGHQNYKQHQSEKSILGKWSNNIIVPPSTEVYVNVITFSGELAKGTFVDQNDHSGSWSVKGDSVTWMYESVPDLNNTFAGKLSEDGKTMTGINYGAWKGEEFKGSWEAIRL